MLHFYLINSVQKANYRVFLIVVKKCPIGGIMDRAVKNPLIYSTMIEE
jgi:hypothetical protein